MTADGTSIADLTATEAVAAVAAGHLTPTQLVEASLAQIEALDPVLKAWVYLDADRARAEATTLSEEARAGRLRGPLHGLPVGVKDVFHVAGMPTKAGSRAGDDFLREEESTVAARLRAAGAIILGKLHTTEFASTLYQPVTRNVWNPEHNPGGSSSGSGAAVGARMVAAAVGTQTGGSTLRPASYNGVFGLIGSSGRISRRNLYAVSWSLDHPGLIARSVDDLALLLSVVAGADPLDDTTLPEPPPPAGVDMSDYAPPRIGLLREYYSAASDPEVAASVEEAATALAKAGASVTPLTLPPGHELFEAARTLIGGAERTTAHARRHAQRAADYSETLRTSIEIGALIPANYYLQAQRVRRWLTSGFLDLFANVDVLLLPTSPVPPPRGDSTGDATFQSLWTFLGYPAGTVPCGLTRAGLPIGLQLVAPPLAEQALLRAMKWTAGLIPPLPQPPMVAALSASA